MEVLCGYLIKNYKENEPIFLAELRDGGDTAVQTFVNNSKS